MPRQKKQKTIPENAEAISIVCEKEKSPQRGRQKKSKTEKFEVNQGSGKVTAEVDVDSENYESKECNNGSPDLFETRILNDSLKTHTGCCASSSSSGSSDDFALSEVEVDVIKKEIADINVFSSERSLQVWKEILQVPSSQKTPKGDDLQISENKLL